MLIWHSDLFPQVEVTYNVTRMGDNDSDDGVNEAIIAGVIAGVVVVMAVVVFGIYRDTERYDAPLGRNYIRLDL